MNLIKRLPLAIGLMFALAAMAQAQPLQLPNIQVVPIVDSASDRTSDRTYELYVKLPSGYDPEASKKYPVIYIADAMWHIEIISGAIEHLVPDAILVGVSWEQGIPTQQSRMRDYMPNKYTGPNYDKPTGLADEHLRFWTEDVFEYVEAEYRVDPKQRTYFGYSVSGTFGGYFLLTQPNAFQNYILGSPATLFQDHLIHEYEPVLKNAPASITANVFVSVGADEAPDSISHAIGLTQFLKSRKREGAEVSLHVVEGADHGRAFPASAIRALYWLAER
jgi:predicted alpha/beta superfamily hydrolase